MAISGDATSNISYQYSPHFPEILRKAGISLAVSTYRTGKVALLSANSNELSVEFHDFEFATGIAYRPDCLAVASACDVWFLPNSREIASQIASNLDACFLARRSHLTGDVQAHELRWGAEELWMVNTLFSCLCTVGADFSFVPRWRPPFITSLAAEDRCHLNGVAFEGPIPRYVTALAQTDIAYGWRNNVSNSGCVIDVSTGEALLQGLSMPHSPRLHAGKLWLLESGCGRLLCYNPVTRSQKTIAELQGYARGLAMYGTLAFVGLSNYRETSAGGQAASARSHESPGCRIAIVELGTGEILATFEFQTIVDEVFDVIALPEIRKPTIRGPRASQEASSTAWVVPQNARNA